jgi:hypothetical protein
MPFLGRNTGRQGVGGAAADPSRSAVPSLRKMPQVILLRSVRVFYAAAPPTPCHPAVRATRGHSE